MDRSARSRSAEPLVRTPRRPVGRYRHRDLRARRRDGVDPREARGEHEGVTLDPRIGRLGIDTSKPGFYDDPTFMAAERADPRMLEAYADFVEERDYTEDYIASAETCVERTAQFLYERLASDGRKGACIDASCVLSRFLERQGVWNYMVKGGLTVVFPTKSGLARAYFSPIMSHDNPAVAGHVWVCAPPFRVVDLTVSLQPYKKGAEKYLTPGPLLAKAPQGRPFELTATDLFDPSDDYQAAYGRPHPTLQQAKRDDPKLFERIERYGAIEVPFQDAQLRYFACGISAPDLPLEEIRSLSLSGKWPNEVWSDFEKAAR